MVLPWVPPTATDHLRRISSASISARRTTGSSLARAAITSGLSGFTAEEMTTTSASARFSGRWPISTGILRSRSRLVTYNSLMSLPRTL